MIWRWLRRRRGRHRRRPGLPPRLTTQDTVEIQRILGGFGPRHAMRHDTPSRYRACALTSTAPIARSLIQAALYPDGRHTTNRRYPPHGLHEGRQR